MGTRLAFEQSITTGDSYIVQTTEDKYGGALKFSSDSPKDGNGIVFNFNEDYKR